MGCMNSKSDINDLHPNIFKVMNVDESLQLLKPGQIEITDTELVWHQKGKPPTKWPLRSLRKYGFDSEIFSFECGRRCVTGPGIYAFRCIKAEQLFNLLQHNIQVRNLSDEVNIAVGDLAISGPSVQRRNQSESHLNPTGNARPSLSRPGSITSNGPVSPVNVSTPPPPEHNNNKRGSMEHTYLNTGGLVMEDGAPPYMNINPSENCSTSHLYMNVNTDVAKELDPNTNPMCDVREPMHNYANIDSNERDILITSSNIDFVTSSLPPTPTYITLQEMNYAELDLPGMTTHAPPDSPNKTKSYVTIDFNKTNALSQSINQRIDHEEGIRKTRHNSTISDARHSNSISD